MNLYSTTSNDIMNFLKEFSTAIKENNLQKIGEHYSIKWNEITKKNYKSTNWPHPVVVEANLSTDVQFNGLFFYLYRERYYNHLFNRFCVFDSKNGLQFSLKDHAESYQNFINLFNLIIKIWREDEQSELKNFELPNVWLWDLIQNFINQCQAYHLWKNLFHLNHLDKEPNKKLIIETTWSVRAVFRYLYIFSWFAGIPIRLGLKIKGLPNSHVHMKQSLGQFSVIGILRMDTLLGDYSSGLECLENLNLKTLNALTMSWSCEITILYHQIFCLMMKARFTDALNNLSEIMVKYESFFNSEVAKKSIMNRFRLWFYRLRQMQTLCKFLSFQYINRKDDNSFHSQKEWILNLYDNSRPDFIILLQKNTNVSTYKHPLDVINK